MKFSGLVLTLALGSSAAFAPSARRASTFHRFSSPVETPPVAPVAEEDAEPVAEKSVATMETPAVPVDLPVEAPVVAAAAAEPLDRIMPGRYDADGMSVAIPFLKRPTKLDGTHAGDFGFDPLGLSEDLDLYTMQESEIRHGRLAMLAVVGWPMGELLGPKWLLQEGGCAPSVLNGFNPITFLATTAIFAGLGYLEYKTSLRSTYDTSSGKQHREDMAEIWDLGVAGDYNFDPLNLYSSIGDSAIARKGLREVEISHGRSAMLGITGFAAWEALTGHAIVENSMFFHPNLLLPALVAGYTAFNFIYRVDNDERYLFQITKTSEGEAILENLKIGSSPSGDNEANMEKLGEFAESAKNAIGNVQKWYDDLNDSYLDYSTSNIKKD